VAQRPNGKEQMAERSTELTIKRRRLPHWTVDGSIYFVTFRLGTTPLSSGERALILDHIRSGHPRFYHLLAATVMPDHVHILLRPSEGISLSRIMKGLKGASARKLNHARSTRGRVWLDESWDRIVRDQKELLEKINYMLDNPYKLGLTDDPWTYEGWHWSGEADLEDDD
jgi:REP element-mobilizing transposase RayT